MYTKVCKRWNSVSMESWKNFKSLTSDSMFQNDRVNSDDSEIKLDIAFAIVLKRCGRFLTKIDLTGFEYFDKRHRQNINCIQSQSIAIAKNIAKQCPNLQYVHLGQLYLTKKSLKSMKPRIKNVESLEIHVSGNVKDEDLSKLFAKCKKLKDLRIEESRSCSKLNGAFLNKLPQQTLIKLVFCNVESIQVDVIFRVCTRLYYYNLAFMNFN